MDKLILIFFTETLSNCSFQRIELEYAKAQAACDAYQTRIASLENDFKKLNHLPQIMDILR